MAADQLRGRVENDVGAERQRRLAERRREGVVDDHDGAGGACDARSPRGGRRRPASGSSATRPRRARHRRRSPRARRASARAAARARLAAGGALPQLLGDAEVRRALRDDARAERQLVEDRVAGREPGGERDAAAALERAERLLECGPARVAVAAVDGVAAVVVRRRRNDRRVQRRAAAPDRDAPRRPRRSPGGVPRTPSLPGLPVIGDGRRAARHGASSRRIRSGFVPAASTSPSAVHCTATAVARSPSAAVRVRRRSSTTPRRRRRRQECEVSRGAMTVVGRPISAWPRWRARAAGGRVVEAGGRPRGRRLGWMRARIRRGARGAGSRGDARSLRFSRPPRS